MDYKTMNQVNQTATEIDKKVVINVNTKHRGRHIPVSKTINNW